MDTDDSRREHEHPSSSLSNVAAKQVVSATQIRIIAAFAAIYVIWGSTYLAIRFSVATIPPLVVSSTRFLFAGIVIYAWMRFVRGAAKPTLVEWRAAAIPGILLTAISNGCTTWAQQKIPSSIAALIIAGIPLVFALLDWLVFGGARPTKRTLAGICIGFVGMALLLNPFGGSTTLQLDFMRVGAIFIAMLAWASGSLYSRGVKVDVSPFLLSGMQMIIGGGSMAVLALLNGDWSVLHPETVSLKSMFAVLYLATFGSIVAFTSYMWLLRVVPSSKVSTYAFVNPVIAVLLGWLFGGETFTEQMLFAAAIIVSSVAMIITTQNTQKQPAKVENTHIAKNSAPSSAQQQVVPAEHGE